MELRLPSSRSNQCCVFDATENKRNKSSSLFVKKGPNEFPDFFFVFAVDADDGFYDIYFFFLILTEAFYSWKHFVKISTHEKWFFEGVLTKVSDLYFDCFSKKIFVT